VIVVLPFAAGRLPVAMASSNILLEDIFHVKNIDEDGKKWVRGRPYDQP
jgi:hypothetical protein